MACQYQAVVHCDLAGLDALEPAQRGEAEHQRQEAEDQVAACSPVIT